MSVINVWDAFETDSLYTKTASNEHQVNFHHYIVETGDKLRQRIIRVILHDIISVAPSTPFTILHSSTFNTSSCVEISSKCSRTLKTSQRHGLN